MKRYYSTQRPVDVGTYPKPQDNKVLDIVNYDERIMVLAIKHDAWGHIDYEKPLSEEDAERYELVSEPLKSPLLKSFEKYYDLLYTGEADEDSDICRELMDTFDMASRICLFRYQLVEERGDLIVSDREVKAFMLAMGERGEIQVQF